MRASQKALWNLLQSLRKKSKIKELKQAGLPPVFYIGDIMNKLNAFLKKHGMLPEDTVPSIEAPKMAEEMKKGLREEDCSLPMIPTYLGPASKIEEGKTAAVIDAGGTNFRSALVKFTGENYIVENLKKTKMPGTESPVEWDEFISFTADEIMPLMDKTDRIGFCFSYSADITPEIDGKVRSIDKEVVIRHSEGKLVGKSLNEELQRRGIFGKKIFIINDTAAVMLGGASVLDGNKYESFLAQVSGTGTNTCLPIKEKNIPKLKLNSEREMIVNTESGMYDGLPMGDFDKILDINSKNPGLKHFEKMTAGVYLGTLCSYMLEAACKEGLISNESLMLLNETEKIDGAVLDAWSCGEKLDELCEDDRKFVKELCAALFCRSARFMCTDLGALMLTNGTGKNPQKPVCICAEGSLVQKSRVYRPELEKLIDVYLRKQLGLNAVLLPVEESTLPGSAAAALLN